MTFLHPNFLYFVLPPLFILFGFLLTQKESQSHFFSDEVMGKLRVSANSLTLKARNALFLVVGFFMVIALAEPVIKDGVVEVKAKSADIMIALDISDSMLATDVYPNRLNLAKQKALSLLDNAPNERIGIVAFAKNSYLVSPLSFDHGAVSFLLRQLDTSSITQKGTDYIGILDVISKVKDDSTKKYLLILSDGGDSNDFSDEIAYAKEKNIVVFVLGIGTKKGAPIKLKDGSFIKHNGDIIVTKLNENISELATKSGGVYIQNTTSDDDIKTMLREIENMSEERELKSQEVQKYTPLFYYPLAMAILFLLIATSSVTRRIKTSIPSILIVTLLVSIDSKAGMLDFMELQKAQEFYKSSDYKNSAITYENHAKATENGQSYYNAGNSYYKDGSYDKALQSYQKATFKDKNQRAKNYSNIGNTHIKQAKEDSLQKAIEAYEKSLKIVEDKEIRENLEAVKKFLEKQKKDSKDDKKSDKDKKEQDKDKKSDDKKDSQDSDENKEKKEKSDKDNKSDEKKDSSKDEKSKDKNESSQNEKSQNEKNKNQSSERNETKPQDKKDELKQLDDKDKRDENKTSSASQSQQGTAMQMSDAEVKKWLQQLNQEKNTYMYRLDTQKPREEDTDEKPW